MDTSVPTIVNPPDIGNGDFSQPLGLRQSWQLPGYGWYTVIVRAAPGSIGLAALGSFVCVAIISSINSLLKSNKCRYTQLDPNEIAALSPASVLPKTTVTVCIHRHVLLRYTLNGVIGYIPPHTPYTSCQPFRRHWLQPHRDREWRVIIEYRRNSN